MKLVHSFFIITAVGKLATVEGGQHKVRIDLKPRSTDWLHQCAVEMGLPYPFRREPATWLEIIEQVGRNETEMAALEANLALMGATDIVECMSKECIVAEIDDDKKITGDDIVEGFVDSNLRRLLQAAGHDHSMVRRVSRMHHPDETNGGFVHDHDSIRKLNDGKADSPTENNTALMTESINNQRLQELNTTLKNLDLLSFLAIPALCFTEKPFLDGALLETVDGSISCPNASITVSANPWNVKSMAVGKEIKKTIFYKDLPQEGRCGDVSNRCRDDFDYLRNGLIVVKWTRDSTFRILNLGDHFPPGQTYYNIKVFWNGFGNQNPFAIVPTSYWKGKDMFLDGGWFAPLGPSVTPMYGNAMYNVPEGSRGEGLGVTALYNLGVNAYSQSALEKANDVFNLPVPTFKLLTSSLFPVMNVSQCYDSEGNYNFLCGESDLDVQMISQYGAGANFGFIPSNQTDDGADEEEMYINYREAFMECDVYPDVLSLSFGGPAPYDEDIDRVFSEFICAGVTPLAATGDRGAAYGTETCAVDRPTVDIPVSPAMYQWVTAVGATAQANYGGDIQPAACMGPTTQAITSTGKLLDDDQWPLPDFQEKAVKDYVDSEAFQDWPFEPNEISNPGRSIPDVSGFGAFVPGVLEVVRNETFYTFNLGGTSAASPAFGGLLLQVRAVLLDAPECYGKTVTFGHLNPFLYWASENHPRAFTDITIGNNVFFGQLSSASNILNCGQGFQCAEGWDPVTGLGMMNFPEFVEAAKLYYCVGVGGDSGKKKAKKGKKGKKEDKRAL